MKPKPTIIDEDTRFNLRFDNLWAIVICVVMIVGTYALMDKRLAMIEQSQTQIIEGQKELASEFRTWRTQAETRLGTVESRQSQVITLLNQHLNVQIK